MRPSLLLALTLLSTSLAAHASIITLDSSSNGTYTYGLDESYSNHGISFNAGNTITLTGLYGVTGATLLPYASGFSLSDTGNSVTLTWDQAYRITYAGCVNFACVYDLVQVQSTSSTIGPVDFSVVASASSSGTVNGPSAPPVSVTPEPSTFVLLGSGTIALAGSLKRRIS